MKLDLMPAERTFGTVAETLSKVYTVVNPLGTNLPQYMELGRLVLTSTLHRAWRQLI